MACPLPPWVSDRCVVPSMGKQAPLSWHTPLRQIQMTSLRSGGSSLMLQRTWTPKSNVPRVAVCCFQLTTAKWDPVDGSNPARPGMLKTIECPQYEYGMGWISCDWHELLQVSVFWNMPLRKQAMLAKLVETDGIFARRDQWLLSTTRELEARMSSLKFSVVGTHHLPRVRLSNCRKCQVWCEKLRSLKEWGEVENVEYVDFDIFKPIASSNSTCGTQFMAWSTWNWMNVWEALMNPTRSWTPFFQCSLKFASFCHPAKSEFGAMVNTDCQARGGYESRICSWHQTKAQGREICRQLVGKDRQLWSWPTNYSLEPGLDPPFRDFVVSVHCQLSPCPLGLAPVQLFIWTDLAGGPCHQHFYWSTTPYRRLWHPWLERWWLFGGCCVNSDCLGVVQRLQWN